MRRSHRGRASARFGPRRRVIAVVATLTVFGGLVGVTQISNAESERAAPACEPTSPPPSAGASEPAGAGENGDAAGGDETGGASPSPSEASQSTASPPPPAAECEEQEEGGEAPGNSGGGAPGGGLESLGDNCDESRLSPHTGFQEGDRCVSTAFGEVGAAEQNPTLLISEAPRRVREGQSFRLVVSTQNLVRDRFLPAAQGGYYRETSLLNDEGLVRGHFHTACRMLTSTTEAAEPAPVPAFFVATEDGKGSDEPDRVIIEVPGLPAGIAQCASWAGDGSHRIPMMARANQIPALDSVRIQVEPAAEEPPAEQPGNEEPPAEQPGNEEPPAEQPGNEEPPAEQPGNEQPPAEQPGQGEQPGQDEQESDEQQPGGSAKPGDDDSDKETPAAPAATESPSGESAGESAGDGTDVVAEAPPARDTGTQGTGGGLALTGANTIAFIVVGVALFIAGAVLIFLTRRRRTVRR
ncbi:LPXTG cell wall anchor domain-containing protein [Plantactinospora sp. WMMC1484]|uniref:LPXTG cell wall anchor domain-containing protein n=1 Tax=Plantactinospora sp. WMMC1484 TaxID=3404122 RepID=UPI003BF48CC6